MGYKKRIRIKKKQAKKRRKARQTLAKKGADPDSYFSSGFRVKRD